MERELADKEERFRTIVENLPIGYSEVDLNMNVTYANNAAGNITGYTQEDVRRGLNVDDMLTEKKKMRENFKHAVEGRRPFPTPYQMKRKNGEIITVLLKSSPVIEQGVSRGVRNIISDITRVPEE
jgi:two-component system, sporulation sensor kinase A